MTTEQFKSLRKGQFVKGGLDNRVYEVRHANQASPRSVTIVDVLSGDWATLTLKQSQGWQVVDDPS